MYVKVTKLVMEESKKLQLRYKGPTVITYVLPSDTYYKCGQFRKNDHYLSYKSIEKRRHSKELHESIEECESTDEWIDDSADPNQNVREIDEDECSMTSDGENNVSVSESGFRPKPKT